MHVNQFVGDSSIFRGGYHGPLTQFSYLKPNMDALVVDLK